MTEWICPCNGCKKARTQAFEEVLQILDSGGDAYFRMWEVRNYVREQLPKKKDPTQK